MSKKVFVGSISWDTTDEGLKDAFSPHGNVLSANVIKDRDTGRSRGFGFVEFENPESAERAIQMLDGTELDGRTIKVDVAQERQRGGDRSHQGNNRGGNRGGNRGRGRQSRDDNY